jgi:pyrophosphatase PpaX
MKGYDPVIFDLDGTVVDTVELIRDSFRHSVRAVLGRELPDEHILAGVGQPLMTQMRLLSEEHAQELYDVYREYNHRRHDELIRGYDGMRELLEGLRAAGRRLGIVTSKSRDTTQMAFAAVRLAEYFDAVVTASDSDEHKPSPVPLRLCLERLGGGAGAAAGDARAGTTGGEPGVGTDGGAGPGASGSGATGGPIYVGDSPVDIVAGRAAGMATAAVDWGVFSREELLAVEPDFYVATPTELLALCLDGAVPPRHTGEEKPPVRGAGQPGEAAPPAEGAAEQGSAP